MVQQKHLPPNQQHQSTEGIYYMVYVTHRFPVPTGLTTSQLSPWFSIHPYPQHLHQNSSYSCGTSGCIPPT